MLEIGDDGRGFEVSDEWVDLARRGHLGLIGMIERAEAIGGQVTIDSTPGAGTHIRIHVPRSDEPVEAIGHEQPAGSLEG